MARAEVEAARAAVAELAGVDVRDVVLTSGGTEANNMALRSVAPRARAGLAAPVRIIASRIEHPSVQKTLEALAREGLAEARWLAVSEAGVIDLADLERALAEGPAALVSVQAANHETGVLQPVGEVLRLCRAREVRVHVDAVQVFGKHEDLWIEAEYRSLAAHKFRGPKGIGALITRPFAKLFGLLEGGAQERGLRPGTVDPVAAAGLRVAAEAAKGRPASYAPLAELRDAFERDVCSMHADVVVAGAAAPRLPHVTNLVFPGLRAPELVAALDLEGVSVSAGAACSAGTVEPSPVIGAMLGAALAGSAVRVSFGPETAPEELLAARAAFRRVLARFYA
jgi:cysteine desulfurase